MKKNLSETIGVVDELYAAAIDTERYEGLLETWSEAIGKSVHDANNLERALESHLDRANEILDIDNVNIDLADVEADNGIIVIDECGDVVCVNAQLIASFGLNEVAGISDLNLRDSSEHRLSNAMELARAGRQQLVVLGTHDQKIFVADVSNNVSAGDTRQIRIETKQLVNSAIVNDLLKDAFGLTPAEADILELVLQGKTPSEIGKIRNRKLPTVRSQLKSLLSKTSTSSQIELIRMAAGLTTWLPYSNGAPKNQHQSGDGPDYSFAKRYRLLTHQNRLIDYSFRGSKEGSTALYFHDEFFGDTITPTFEKYLVENSIRLLCVFRPGYGDTSDAGSRKVSQETIAQDIQAVLQQTGIRTPIPIVAHGVGMHRAVMFAQKNPKLIKSIVGVRASVPWDFKSDFVREPRFIRFVVLLSKSAPKSFEFVTKAGYKYFLRYGAEEFLKRYFVTAEADKVALQSNDEIMAAIDEGGKHAFKNGPSGLARDLVASKQSWRVAFEALSCPITLLIGEDDPTTRFQRSMQLAKANPRVKIHTIKDAGHLALFSHPDLVIEPILEAIGK